MKKILFIKENITYGGSSKIFVWLAKQLSHKYQVDICYIKTFNNIKDSKGISVFKLDCVHLYSSSILRNSFNIFVQVRALYKLLKNEKYDIVISFGEHEIYPVFLTRMIVPFKLLVSERVDPFSIRRFSDVIRRYIFRFSDGIIFQTQKAMEYFPKGIQKISTVIPNPVIGNNNIKWEIKNTRNNIITVARIDMKQKRFDVLINAFEKVLQKHPNYKLTIVGSGNDENKVKKLIENKRLSSQVELLGYCNNAIDLLLKSKLFVLSSDFEGIPNALIEAIQIGMPVVSTDCSPGGAKLLLDSGKYGILTKCADANLLAEAICEVISSDENIQYYSNKTKGALDRFDESIISQMWIKYIQNKINK